MNRGRGRRTIVCALDDSDGAPRAAAVAAELGEQLDARLVLVHVVPPPTLPGASAVPHAQTEVLRHERERAAEVLARFDRPDALADADRRVVAGRPADAIVELAREEEAHMVVIGSHARGALRRAVLGSVSAAVAARAPCPVVVVPPDPA